MVKIGNKEVTVWDSSKKEVQVLECKPLLFVLDEPGAAKNGMWSAHGAKQGCPDCKLTGRT